MQKINSELKSLKQEIYDIKLAIKYSTHLNNTERIKSNSLFKSLNEKLKRDLKFIEHKQELTTIRMNKVDLITLAINENLTEILKSKDVQECLNMKLNAYETQMEKFKLMPKLYDGRSKAPSPLEKSP